MSAVDLSGLPVVDGHCHPLFRDPTEVALEAFLDLFSEGRALSFPCDVEGHVDCDALPGRALNNYLFARAMIGREFTMPAVTLRYAQPN